MPSRRLARFEQDGVSGRSVYGMAGCTVNQGRSLARLEPGTASGRPVYGVASCGTHTLARPEQRSPQVAGRSVYAYADCCYSSVCIAIVNSNAAIDDNFDVLLNGVFIGFLDLGVGGRSGGFWRSDPTIPPQAVSQSRGWESPPAFSASASVFALDSSLLRQGVNSLRMQNVHSNANANFGQVIVGLASLVAGVWSIPIGPAPGNYLESWYSGPNFASFDFTFTLP